MTEPIQPEDFTLDSYTRALEALFARQSEPYHMQDARLAMRRIEAQRAAIARQRAIESQGRSAEET